MMLIDENIILEGQSISSLNLGIGSKRNKRYINISYQASHAGRMKISKIGSSDLGNNNGTLYYDKGQIMEDKSANLSKIGMSSKERRAYYDLALRHHVLMNCVNGINTSYNVNLELVHDELLYRMGYEYERSEDGIATVYLRDQYKNKYVLYKRDINGNYIYNPEKTSILALVDNYNNTHNDTINYLPPDLY